MHRACHIQIGRPTVHPFATFVHPLTIVLYACDGLAYVPNAYTHTFDVTRDTSVAHLRFTSLASARLHVSSARRPLVVSAQSIELGFLHMDFHSELSKELRSLKNSTEWEIRMMKPGPRDIHFHQRMTMAVILKTELFIIYLFLLLLQFLSQPSYMIHVQIKFQKAIYLLFKDFTNL